MVSVTLTTFIDFLTSTNPTTRIAQVRKAKKFYEDETPYELRSFYLPLSRAMVAHLRGDQAALTRAVAQASAHRKSSYETNVKGFRSWEKRAKPTFVRQPTKTVWASGGLEVTVNPELHVGVDGRPHVIKLYLKTATLSQRRIAPVLHLLQTTHGTRQTEVGILDVRRHHLFLPGRAIPDIGVLLDAEALAFAHMWDAL